MRSRSLSHSLRQFRLCSFSPALVESNVTSGLPPKTSTRYHRLSRTIIRQHNDCCFYSVLCSRECQLIRIPSVVSRPLLLVLWPSRFSPVTLACAEGSRTGRNLCGGSRTEKRRHFKGPQGAVSFPLNLLSFHNPTVSIIATESNKN